MSRDRNPEDTSAAVFETGAVKTTGGGDLRDELSGDFQGLLQTDTRTLAATGESIGDLRVPALTVLWHPDSRRVGERALLPELASGRAVALSRLEPRFRAPGSSAETALPLGDPHLSRRPLHLEPLDERSLRGVPREAPSELGVRLDVSATGTEVQVQSSTVGRDESSGAFDLGPADLERGTVLLLARRVALLLHRQDPSRDLQGSGDDVPRFAMVGESDVLEALRRDLHRVAALSVPVLLRGETGTGKELAAAAIHQASPRRDEPFVAVNAAAIPPTLAAAELFGAQRGAYTGADQAREGLFRRADGGTLFLDEIGELPAEVQPLLLRVLESGEVQTVGGRSPKKVDVRLVAATDLDLEAAVDSGSFRAPLFHRLSSYVVQLPTLAARRDDFGRLLLHFLFQELEELGATGVLDRGAADARTPPWLAADLVARLAAAPWPGNLRELRNVARKLAVTYRDQPRVLVGPELAPYLKGPSPAPSAAPSQIPAGAPEAPEPPELPKSYRPPSEVTEEELLAALEANRYRLKPTAAQLGVSRPSLYNLVHASASVRTAADLQREELDEAWKRHGGDLEGLVDEFRISADALRRRLKELEIGPQPIR